MSTKILVVEDATPLRKDILEMLGYEGFQVVGAEDGIAGVQRAREFMPDLVICDIMMPGMNGYEVLETLRKDRDTSTIPFIFLTARTDRVDMRQGMEMGANDYLTKPFTAAELLASVNARLRDVEAHREKYDDKLSKLSGNIALALPHELYTPLHLIIGFADVLMTDAEQMDSENLVSSARILREGALRLKRLVENCITYAHLEILRADPKQVENLKSESVSDPKTIMEMVAQKAGLVLQKSDNLPRIEDLRLDIEVVDRLPLSEDALRKIVDELLENAFKFSERGTPVELSGRALPGTYVITVRDQGRGMTPEQIREIGAYMQFDRAIYEQQGTGLGLIIAKRLTELHKGEFLVESTPGQGTSVQVRLPMPTA